eukprot:5263343-Alexandrium_andersonii.AAC.1
MRDETCAMPRAPGTLCGETASCDNMCTTTRHPDTCSSGHSQQAKVCKSCGETARCGDMYTSCGKTARD